MKTIHQIFKITLVTLFTGVLLFGCDTPPTISSDSILKPETFNIPKMLQRNYLLGSDTEKELIMDTYNKHVNNIQKKADSHSSYLGLAELFIAEARISGEHPYYYPAALNAIDYVLKQANLNKTTMFHALSLKSGVLLSLHQFEEALEVTKKAIAINPHNSQIYGALVDAHVELGDYKSAVVAADKMVQIRPDLRSYSRISYLREIHGDIEGAIVAMQMAVEAGYPGNESSEWARCTLAKIYENYGQLQNAEMHYTIALKNRPNYPFAIEGLANIQLKKGKFEEAESLYKKAISIMPEISFYRGLGGVYEATNRPAEVKALGNKILAMMSEDEKSGHKMELEKSYVYLEMLQNHAKAEKCAEKAYAARPTNIDVNILMSVVHLSKGEFSAAEPFLKAATKTDSKQPLLYLCKGLYAFNNNQKKLGEDLINEAFKRDPYLSSPLSHEGKKVLEGTK